MKQTDDIIFLSDFYVILYDCFSLQLKRMMESDAAMTEDLIAYNIIPLDGPTLTNAIVRLPEVSLLLFMYVSTYLVTSVII